MQDHDSGTNLDGWPGRSNHATGAAPIRIGRYRVERALGTGSFGDVSLAIEDGPLARRVALKRVNQRGVGTVHARISRKTG